MMLSRLTCWSARRVSSSCRLFKERDVIGQYEKAATRAPEHFKLEEVIKEVIFLLIK